MVPSLPMLPCEWTVFVKENPNNKKWIKHNLDEASQLAFTCSMSTRETSEQCSKSV